MNLNENKTKRWYGEHLGVRFEINNYPNREWEHWVNGGWTYYLYINLERLSNEDAKKFWLKKRENNGITKRTFYEDVNLPDIELHCGLSWYSKESGFDDDDRIVKIGCDYQHLWDEEYQYDRNIESIQEDVKNSIESFRLLFPDYKYWCHGNGNLYNINEGRMIGESFRSHEYDISTSYCPTLARASYRKRGLIK